MDQLTFKDYLVSKAQLKNALNETPYKIAKYKITKYCKLQLSEGDEVLLKPSHEIIVEWLYDDINNPTAQCVIVMTKESNTNISVKRDSIKLAKWLAANSEAVD